MCYCIIQIAAYPGEKIKLRIIPYDEQNFTAANKFEIRASFISVRVLYGVFDMYDNYIASSCSYIVTNCTRSSCTQL